MRLAPACCARLGGFVSNGGPNLIGHFWSYFVYLMSGAGVLGGLLQDLLFGFAASYEITVSDHVITAHYFRHRTSFVDFRNIGCLSHRRELAHYAQA